MNGFKVGDLVEANLAIIPPEQRFGTVTHIGAKTIAVKLLHAGRTMLMSPNNLFPA